MARRIGSNNREAERRIMDALQIRLSAQFDRQMRIALARDYDSLIKQYESFGAFDPVTLDKERTGRIIIAGWEQTASVFGDRFRDQVGKRHGNMEKKDLIADMFRAAFTQFASKWIATKVTQIASTTMDQIRQAILRGEDEGLSVPDIGNSMRSRIPGLSALRANTIARTETHFAAGWANQESAEISGIDLMREWCSAEDERTREAHAEADGQIVSMTQPFDIGGESLQYPGDAAGSAENVINCRCQALYLEP